MTCERRKQVMIELGLLIRLLRLFSFVARTTRTMRALPGIAGALVLLLSGRVTERWAAGRS